MAGCKAAPVFVGSVVPFVIFDNCRRGCCFGCIAADVSTPHANAIPERPATRSAICIRVVE